MKNIEVVSMFRNDFVTGVAIVLQDLKEVYVFRKSTVKRKFLRRIFKPTANSFCQSVSRSVSDKDLGWFISPYPQMFLHGAIDNTQGSYLIAVTVTSAFGNWEMFHIGEKRSPGRAAESWVCKVLTSLIIRVRVAVPKNFVLTELWRVLLLLLG